MRNILVINESKTMRTLLRRYILSELSDFEVHDAASGEEAIQKLQEMKVELIISGNKMRGMDGPSIHRIIHEIPSHRQTPFMVITSSKAEEELLDLLKKGVEHFLISPFTSADLGIKINTICNPRSWRTQDRLSIPGTKAIIHLERETVEAAVVNISPGGLLCDLKYSESHGNILKSLPLSIKFPPEYDNAHLVNVQCKFLRLNMLSCREDFLPDQIRMGWQFIDISEKNRQILDNVFEKAKGELKKLTEA